MKGQKKEKKKKGNKKSEKVGMTVRGCRTQEDAALIIGMVRFIVARWPDEFKVANLTPIEGGRVEVSGRKAFLTRAVQRERQFTARLRRGRHLPRV